MDAPDNTDADVANLFGSPKPASQQQSQPAEEDRSLDEIMAQSSTDLLHAFAASIQQGAMREAAKEEEFRQEFRRRLVRVIIGTYVWSTARIAHETETHEATLGSGVQELLSAEREQGRSSPPAATMLERLRTRLTELMEAVGRAVEMFTQF